MVSGLVDDHYTATECYGAVLTVARKYVRYTVQRYFVVVNVHATLRGIVVVLDLRQPIEVVATLRGVGLAIAHVLV